MKTPGSAGRARSVQELHDHRGGEEQEQEEEQQAGQYGNRRRVREHGRSPWCEVRSGSIRLGNGKNRCQTAGWRRTRAASPAVAAGYLTPGSPCTSVEGDISGDRTLQISCSFAGSLQYDCFKHIRHYGSAFSGQHQFFLGSRAPDDTAPMIGNFQNTKRIDPLAPSWKDRIGTGKIDQGHFRCAQSQ